MISIVNDFGEIPVLSLKGKTIEKFSYIVSEVSKVAPVVIPAVSVVTFNNRQEQTVLDKQLSAHGIGYYNFAEGESVWSLRSKTKLLAEKLPQITTEYVLVLDCDSSLLTPAAEYIIERFKSYDKKVLFAATSNRFPNVSIDKVADRDSWGKFKWLSSSCCFGKTEDVLRFYTIVKQQGNFDNIDRREQVPVREVFGCNQDWVGIDYKRAVFQTFSDTAALKNGDNCYLVI